MSKSIFVNYEYLFENEIDFRSAVKNLLSKYKSTALPLRVVLFGSPKSNLQYLEQLIVVKAAFEARWGDRAPIVIYLAQPPLFGSTVVMEVQTVELSQDETIEYKSYENRPYIVIKGPWGRKLVAGAIQANNLDSTIESQSDEIFDIISKILSTEGFRVENIVRQWNYLERITEFDGDVQRYQGFNDSRSRFYAKGNWSGGFPAATGIGTQWGGALVGLDALDLTDRAIGLASIDNTLQVAAHDYTNSVLLGEGRRSTPKFERAKAVWDGEQGLVYISGTAAIRGEESLGNSTIEEQTIATLENIDFLVSQDNLESYGVDQKGVRKYGYFRVYLKEPEFFEKAKQVIERNHGDVPAVYILSSVCRCELLIEIEGVLKINY